MAAPSSTSGTHCVCDCLHASSLLVAEIRQASEKLPLHPVALDDALLLGRRLALQWEQMNACLNVEEHLDAVVLLATTDAIQRVLGLYKILLETSCTREHTQTRSHAGHPSSPSVQSHSPPASPRSQMTTAPISLGMLELDGEEALIVFQEALRHMISRLGEMLKDIEEESWQELDGMGEARAEILGDTGKARTLMLRLLGRVSV